MLNKPLTWNYYHSPEFQTHPVLHKQSLATYTLLQMSRCFDTKSMLRGAMAPTETNGSAEGDCKTKSMQKYNIKLTKKIADSKKTIAAKEN